jgi:cyclopropane-fatty-acyl-phospholipid synthase
MIEHVGADQLEGFMHCVARLLKPGGKAVLHTMVGGDTLGIPAGKQLRSFSTKTIMPIGYVPNPEELTRAVVKTKRLSVVHAERFGPHYGKTMRQWRDNVLDNRELIERRYSAEHVRVYDYVFGMAAACFTSGTFDLLQLVVQTSRSRIAPRCTTRALAQQRHRTRRTSRDRCARRRPDGATTWKR